MVKKISDSNQTSGDGIGIVMELAVVCSPDLSIDIVKLHLKNYSK